MVVNGFSLFDLRKLYIDELYFFYEEMFFALEKMGKIESGSYDKLTRSKDGAERVETTVDQLRKQMFKVIADRSKTKK
jgi:hypothetical protein